ncbi:FecCD family ABC transporter permease [Nocardioides sp. GXQ0305]|uniref:FecCD family ABC transporter permease n=1 Tax=Nocardioides sp. GXQ0305 TaxID=3423912 RepID=UPI003D7F0B7A
MTASSTAPDLTPAAPPSRGRGRRFGAARSTVLLAAVLVVAVVASLSIGAVLVSPFALLDPSHADHAIVRARLDRTVIGLTMGVAFGLAGTLMQGMTRNPLADPGLLGVNAGAAFAMVLGIGFLGASGLSEYVWFGFAGAAVATLLVHVLAGFGREGATPAKLAMAGAAVTAGLTSWTTGVLLVQRQTVEQIRGWQIGSVAGRELDVLLPALPFLVVGVVIALSSGRVLDALALGDDLARGLGRRTTLDRVVVGTAVVLLAGTGTAVAGPIAFVGLVVPHMVRSMVGSDYVRLLPLSAGYAAALLVVADTVGRVVLPPQEVQVGVMTAVIGVPVFVTMIRRGRTAAL